MQRRDNYCSLPCSVDSSNTFGAVDFAVQSETSKKPTRRGARAARLWERERGRPGKGEDGRSGRRRWLAAAVAGGKGDGGGREDDGCWRECVPAGWAQCGHRGHRSGPSGCPSHSKPGQKMGRVWGENSCLPEQMSLCASSLEALPCPSGQKRISLVRMRQPVGCALTSPSCPCHFFSSVLFVLV